MNKLILATKIRDMFFSAKAFKTLGFIIFTFILTAIIASQNFFFQGILL